MYITCDVQVARIAEKSGVDVIFIDLETIGKDKRQGHLDTVISRHRMEDVNKIEKVLTRAELLVRVNPVYGGSKDEIDRVIDGGAGRVMLPFFKTVKEVESFIGHVNGRAKTCLLWETPDAVDRIDEILGVEGIDSVHIGLNDLHIGYNMKFMFELLADGTVEKLCYKFKEKGIPYGFGGIARLGEGTLPAEYIIAEHYRLGSGMAILSRSFCNTMKTADIGKIESLFKSGIREIREYEAGLLKKDREFFGDNRNAVIRKVREITNSMRDSGHKKE